MRDKKGVVARGFTIVELLIVIVVIGILAAITIVAYNGVQARAEQVKIVSAATNARDALLAYHAINGQYPSTSTVCLGTGYVDHTGDGIPDCRWNSGNISPSTSFNAALATVSAVSSPVSQNPVTSGTAGVIGMYYMTDTSGQLDGVPQTAWLVYAVAGQHCSLIVPHLTGTYPIFTSKNDDTVTEVWGSGGLCWVPLPD